MNSANDKQRKALGKGLSALLPGRPQPASATPRRPPLLRAQLPRSPERCRIESDPANPMQPRTVFQLGRARGTRGLDSRQRNHPAADRPPAWATATRSSRASAAGGPPNSRSLTEVPWSFRMSRIARMLEIALIENIQREDLNPIETAHAFERLGRELGCRRKKSAGEPARTGPRSRTSSGC